MQFRYVTAAKSVGTLLRWRHRFSGRALAVPLLVITGLLTSCTQDWPSFGHDPGHSGLTAETMVGADQAASLGVKWQANTGQAVYASPVVAFNIPLNKQLVHVGNDGGVMSAFDAVTGARVWARQVGARIDSTASVVNGVVYFGSADKRLYAFGRDDGRRSLHVRLGRTDLVITAGGRP